MTHARFATLAALLFAGSTAAQELAPEPGRYLPLYPGFYWTGGITEDPRDSAYDQGGARHDSATPTYAGQTRFPEKAVVSGFTWHFPMFESQDIPFFSSRMHLARATLRYVDTQTEGTLSDFAAQGANNEVLKNNGSGIGDMTLEFGSYLLGVPASGWRSGERWPVTVLLTAAVNAPVGVYEHESPNNAGTNHWAFSGKLAASATPWPGGFVDGAWALRVHSINYEPEFGGQAPYRTGADHLWDVSVGQRVREGLYVSLFASGRKGRPNQYRNLDYTPNAPAAPAPSNGNYSSRDFPTPGTYFDGGTSLFSYGLGAQYFLTQRWLVALNWTRPHAGKSGEFTQPYTNRQCTVSGGQSSAVCTDAPDGSVRVDGLGSARSYASDSLLLSVTHHFGLGDAFSCAGCKK